MSTGGHGWAREAWIRKMEYPLRPDESQTLTVLTDLAAAASFVSPINSVFDSFLMLQNINFQPHCLTLTSRAGQ